MFQARRAFTTRRARRDSCRREALDEFAHRLSLSCAGNAFRAPATRGFRRLSAACREQWGQTLLLDVPPRPAERMDQFPVSRRRSIFPFWQVHFLSPSSDACAPPTSG
jgi:hypothetical protein